MARANVDLLTVIPERTSSKILYGTSTASMLPTPSRAPSSIPAEDTLGPRYAVPKRGRAESPIRRPDDSNPPGHLSTTFVPSILPNDLLDAPRLGHPRVSLAIHLSSPIYMGGATLEGEVKITTDGGIPGTTRKQKPTLSLKKLSVTLIGIERCKGRQEIFRALMSDVIDRSNHPPMTMAPILGPDATWDVQPSESKLPFRLDLPVLMGPPPYKSKEVGISYSLSTIAEFRIGGKKYFARESRDVVVLTVHDRRSLTFHVLRAL